MSSPNTPTNPDPTTSSPSACPRCGTVGVGRFCAECGAPRGEVACSGCGEPLTAGAKFCHRCGTAAGDQRGAATTPQAPAQKASLSTTLPWAVAGIAFLALFAMLAGKGFNAKRGSALDAPATALPNPALDGPMAGPMGQMGETPDGPMGGAAGGMRAPDISSMDPSEIAERLFNRVMLLNSQGKRDSVQFFAPMAIEAYSMLVDRQGHPITLDQRYDIGRIAEAAGALPLAKAQADTILQQRPKHLLGLLLAARVAKAAGSTPSYQEYATQFQQAKNAELAKPLPEYEKHQTDIEAGP